ncbi:MAG: Lrp/AsnC family transcriptional regulator [Candidatus Thorarchaeota archaeon]
MQSIPDKQFELLRLMLSNSRLSVSTLAERIGKGRNWVTTNVKRLVEKRIIRSYVTILDPAQVYAERNTITLIKTNPRETGVSESLLKMKALESLDGISGEHSLLGLFRFRDTSKFEEFLDDIDKVVAGSGSQNYNLVQVLATYKTHGFSLERTARSSTTIASSDWELMKVLSRFSPSEEHTFPLTQLEIGKKMQPTLSQPAVSKAMRRLEERGAIVGYSIELEFNKIGLPIKFFLEIKPQPGMIAETARRISHMKEVWALHRVGEDFSLFATVRTESVDKYNSFLRALYANEDILDTRSQISLEEWLL